MSFKITCLYGFLILSLIFLQSKPVIARESIAPITATSTDSIGFNTQDRLVQHPQNPQIMYLYEEAEAYGNTGLLRSTDGGTTWSYLSITGAQYTIEQLELDPTNPALVYVVSGRKLYRSTDGGLTWLQLLDQDVTGYGGSAFALSQHTLFVLGDVPNTLKMSVDYGTTWQVLATPDAFSAVFVDPYDAQMLYAKHQDGIYASSDHGQTWSAPSTLVPPEAMMIFDPHHLGTIYAVMPWTIYKTSDRAQTWTTFFAAAPYEVVVDFSLDPQIPDTIYVSYYNGYVCMHLCGLRSEPSTPPHSQSLLLQMVPPHGLSKSTDGGITWNAISPSTGTKYEAFALHPLDSLRLYAVQNGSLTTPQQAWTSFDAGTTWTPMQCGDQILDVYPDAANPTIAYLAKRDGIYKTTDHGASCTPLAANQLMAGVEDVIVDPHNPDLIYALTTYGGVFKSSDRGQTWNAHNQGLRMDVGAFNRLLIDSNQPTTLYVIKNYQYLYKSVDGGVTWVESVFSTKYLKDIVIDPIDSNMQKQQSLKNTAP